MNPSVIGGFLSKRASYAESVSMPWWRHRDQNSGGVGGGRSGLPTPLPRPFYSSIFFRNRPPQIQILHPPRNSDFAPPPCPSDPPTNPPPQNKCIHPM